MGMTASVRPGLAALTCAVLTACGAHTTVSDSEGDCVSHYDPVASAPTWTALKEAMKDDEGWGRVASVRTQARGEDVGAGDEKAVRVVDLLDRKGRRLVQVEAWRTTSGAWRAGVWNQCTD